MFQTTRRRLAIWYTTVTAILLIIFVSGFYWYVRNTLVERLDDTLNHVVEVVQRSLIIEPDTIEADAAAPSRSSMSSNPELSVAPFHVNIAASFQMSGGTVDDDHIDLEWFSADGELLWTTLEHPLTIPLHVNPYGETVHQSNSQVLRQVTQRIRSDRQVLGYLRVSHPWFEVTRPTRTLMVDLIFGSIVTLGTVAGIGWFLSGLAMAPVSESYQRLRQFTADASHELRNPIAVIQTNVQVALADPDPDPMIQQAQFQIVERITRRLGRLVDDLLFLARQDSGIAQLSVNPIALSGVVQDVVDEQQAIATLQDVYLSLNIQPERIDTAAFNAKFPDSPMPSISHPPSPLNLIHGDRNQLYRLFTNLVSNAIQYTPDQGKIQLQIATRPAHPKRQTPDLVEIKIQDTGIGIASEDLPHIFDRFYQVDPTRSPLRSRPKTPHSSGPTSLSGSSGSGLGLSIAKAIVDNHSGHINVTSQLNQGTTVTVTFPLI